jgi:molybdopterin-binding protein
MRLSARNVLSGKILHITEGSVNSEVVVEIAPGVEIVSVVTKSSVEALGLKVGGQAYAVIKASSVMLGID